MYFMSTVCGRPHGGPPHMNACGQGGVGRDGALVESITFNRRVMGSTPALAVM